MKAFGEGLTSPDSAVAYPGGAMALTGPQVALDVGNQSIHNAGPATALSVDPSGAPVVSQSPNLSLLPKITKPSFRQTSSDSAGNVTKINKSETNLGKLLHILRGGLQGGLDSIAGGALDQPRNGESPATKGVQGAIQMPLIRQQQFQQRQNKELDTQARRQHLQMYPLQLQKTQADIQHLQALAAQEDAASKRQPRTPALSPEDQAFQFYTSQGMNPAQARAKILQDAQDTKPQKSEAEQPIERQLADLDTKIRQTQGTGEITPGKANVVGNSNVDELLARRRDLVNAINTAHPKQPDRFSSNGGDIQDTVQSIMDGTAVPVLTNYSFRDRTAIAAGLHRAGYNQALAEQDWKATQKHLSTLNGQQQERLRQAISFTSDSLDNISNLYDQWKKTAGVSGYKIFNKGNLALSKQLAGSSGSIATNLEAQISDLTSELGTVYKGGNSSTDESLKLAAKNLSADWNEKTFNDAIKQIRNNLRIRKNSIYSSQPIGVSPNSPYSTPAPDNSAPPPGAKVRDYTNLR